MINEVFQWVAIVSLGVIVVAHSQAIDHTISGMRMAASAIEKITIIIGGPGRPDAAMKNPEDRNVQR